MTDPHAQRERVARIIDPSSWRVFDSYLAEVKRKYKGADAAYDPESFKDKASLAKADAILEALALPSPAGQGGEADEERWLAAHDALEAAREHLRGSGADALYAQVNTALYAVRSRGMEALAHAATTGDPSMVMVPRAWLEGFNRQQDPTETIADNGGSVWDFVCHQARQFASRAGGAMADIAAERARQVEVEGWTPEHDDGHRTGEIAHAAADYILPGQHVQKGSWAWKNKHPDSPDRKDRRRQLVIGAALVVAEIERLDRAAPSQTPGGGPKT